MVFLILLGVVDVIAALIFLSNGLFPAGIVCYVAWIMLLKGLYSFLTALLSGFPYDILGLIDIVAGLALMFSLPFSILWIPLILKGAYSMMVGSFMK